MSRMHGFVIRVLGFGLLVRAFLNRKERRNGFKSKVRVFTAHFLNSGEVPLSFGVMPRFFVN